MAVKNLYLTIPGHFLHKVSNPNIALHGLKLPFRMCIVAPSGSGKTNWLVNLITKFSDGEGTFHSIRVVTRDKDEPLYKYLESVAPVIQITEGLQTLPPLVNKTFDKEFNHLVVLDDLVLSKDLSAVEQYYIRCRKLNVSIIFISQSFYKIPKIIRSNCSYMVLLKLSGQREVNMILSEFSLGVTKEQLLRTYDRATSEKFSPLILDLEAPPTERFRRGFTEILNPSV